MMAEIKGKYDGKSFQIEAFINGIYLLLVDNKIQTFPKKEVIVR